MRIHVDTIEEIARHIGGEGIRYYFSFSLPKKLNMSREKEQGLHWYSYDPASKEIKQFNIDSPVIMEKLQEDHILICHHTMLGLEGYLTFHSKSFVMHKEEKEIRLNDIEKAVLIAVNNLEAAKPGIKHFRLHELNKAGWKMSKIEYYNILRFLINSYLMNRKADITEKGKRLVEKYPNLVAYQKEVVEKKKGLGHLYNGTT